MSSQHRMWFDFLSRGEWSREGVNETWLLTHHSVAKVNSENSPYLIPNEWICGRIASFLGLPIPPFALFRHGPKGKRYFASLRFGTRDSTPDDTDPGVLVAKYPELCSGIILFDVLVANADRHPGNLKVDNPSDPREVWIFDHERALLGPWKGEGARRMSRLRDRLGVSGGSATGENRHCLLDVINTADHFTYWLDRIHAMPKTFIEDACSHVVGLGIKKRLAAKLVEFLDHRRCNLNLILEQHEADFPAISRWPMLL